jgi:hypothetical protein
MTAAYRLPDALYNEAIYLPSILIPGNDTPAYMSSSVVLLPVVLVLPPNCQEHFYISSTRVYQKNEEKVIGVKNFYQ